MGAAWCRQAGIVDRHCDRLCCIVGERTSRATGCYCGVVLLVTLLTFALSELTVSYFQTAHLMAGCGCHTCFRQQIVLRAGFAMWLCFSGLAALVWLAPHCVAFHAYYSWWLVKALVAAAVWFGLLFLSNSTVHAVSYLFAAISGLFLLAQVVVLIDWAHSWNELWRGAEPPERCTGWRIGIVASSVVLVGSAGVLAAFAYGWYDCRLGLASLSVALVVGAALMAVGVWAEHSALLPGAVVLFEAVALTVGGLRHDRGCGGAGGGGETLVALAVAALTVTQAAWSVIRNADHAAGIRERGVVLDLRPQAAPGEPPPDPQDDACGCWAFDHALPERGAAAYLLILATSMAYMAMVLSGWAVDVPDACDGGDTGERIGLWVQLASAWTTLAVYAWALAAPTLLPGRRF